MNNPFLATFASEAALVAPHARDRFESCLNMLASPQAVADLHKAKAEAHDDFWPSADSYLARFRPYVVRDGVLQIPVRGVLLHGFPYQFLDYATGYEYVQKAFERGMADGSVKGIALLIDSPGGHVAGNFDLVDKMFSYRGQKPVRAFAAEHAYSAAYSIASVADQLTVSRTGGVGSIGVVTMHIDASKMMEEIGWKVTFIHAGKHKVDGNPYEPLPEAVKERIQAKIDALYDIFVATVARNRGLDEQAVRDTEALTFTASEALSNRLADQIGALDDGLAAFAANLNSNEGGTTMSENKDEKAVDQAAIDTARAEGKSQGVTEGTAAGASTERARIGSIINAEESKNRLGAAINIALTTDLSVDQAKTLLATLPEDKAVASNGSGMFVAAMEGGDNPNLGSGEGDEPQSAASEILSDYRAVTGQKAN